MVIQNMNAQNRRMRMSTSQKQACVQLLHNHEQNLRQCCYSKSSQARMQFKKRILLKLHSLIAAWLFWTFKINPYYETIGCSKSLMIIISHTYLFTQIKWTFVEPCVLFWNIFAGKNSPQIDSFKRTQLEWDSFTELFSSNIINMVKII